MVVTFVYGSLVVGAGVWYDGSGDDFCMRVSDRRGVRGRWVGTTTSVTTLVRVLMVLG